jgi:hypothetical protein
MCRLEGLASSLEAEHPGAAGSIREGLDETLTLQRMGIEGALYQTLPLLHGTRCGSVVDPKLR